MSAGTAESREARLRRREAALALRAQMSPSAPAPDHLRIATWNVNSLKARTPAVRRFLTRAGPDVFCLQETKADSDIFHPDAVVGLTHVTAPEREALAAVLDAGLVDLDARQWDARQRRFTWWNHALSYSRNLGMRIDLLAADAGLAGRLVTTWIDHVERAGRRQIMRR